MVWSGARYLPRGGKHVDAECMLMHAWSVMGKSKPKQTATAIAALGGMARKEALTPAQRSDIAAKAAQARWASGAPVKAHLSGVIEIGDAKIPCAVLTSGQRVLSENAITYAILGGRSGASKRLKERGAPLPLFLAPSNLTPYISKEMIDGPLRPVEYRDGDRTVMGYDATLLPLVCDVWLKARADGALQKQQLDKAMKAEILTRSLAKVGIIALVDEATGYQYERARHALADILEAFIAKELADWAKTFDDEFYREIFRLRGWDATDIRRRPGVVGKWTTDIVYARLAPGVLDELKRVTPRDDRGKPKAKYFQSLTNTGVQSLLKHLGSVTTLMNVSDSWSQFMDALERRHPKYNTQLLLSFIETEQRDRDDRLTQ